jgi:hypothetical protein
MDLSIRDPSDPTCRGECNPGNPKKEEKRKFQAVYTHVGERQGFPKSNGADIPETDDGLGACSNLRGTSHGHIKEISRHPEI